jgi:hypothetical protein
VIAEEPSKQDGRHSTSDGTRHRPWWLLVLPLSYLLHLAEEWWGGEGFATWTARALGSPVSTTRFIVLNAIVWPLFCVLTVAAILRPKLAWFTTTFATVVLINAALHALGTLATSTYSPGLLTALVLYVPAGVAALSLGRRSLSPGSCALATFFGFLIHGLVAVIAFARS